MVSVVVVIISEAAKIAFVVYETVVVKGLVRVICGKLSSFFKFLT